MFHGRKIEEPLFACFPEICPHCREATEFWLYRATGSGWVGIIPLYIGGEEHLLRCRLCGFSRYLEKGEVKSYKTVAQLFCRVRDGELKITEFFEQMKLMNVPTLLQIHSEAAFWICPSCAEENPANFSECWNCRGTARRA